MMFLAIFLALLYIWNLKYSKLYILPSSILLNYYSNYLSKKNIGLQIIFGLSLYFFKYSKSFVFVRVTLVCVIVTLALR